MDLISLMVTFIGIIAVVLLFAFTKRNSRLPPGPIVWPFIGNLVEILWADSVYPHLALAKLAKQYGNIMGIGFGMNYSVVVSGFEEIKDIFRRNEVSEERFEFPFVKDRSFNKKLGILFSDGEVWRDIRRFTVNQMVQFGFGNKNSMDILLEEETETLIKSIRKSALENNGIWDVESKSLGPTAVNALWVMLAGKRFNHDDKQLLKTLSLNDKVADIVGQNNIYNAFPFLIRICPKLVQHDVHMQTHWEIQNWIKGIIHEIQEQRLQRCNKDAQCVVEAFWDKINEGTDRNFTEEQLIVVMQDLFLAGSETPTTALKWIILFLTLNPRVQQKLQDEIREATSLSDYITVQGAGRLRYLNAVILEALRYGNLAPLGPPRLATEDIILKDFTIPKGAAVIFNTAPVLTDEKIWGDPDVFRPERFLDDSGEIVPEAAEKVSIVFGYGKRNCPGEFFARDSLNMFVLAIIRNFRIEPIPGKEPSKDNHIASSALQPRPYSVRLVAI